MSIFKTYKITFDFTDEELYILLCDHLISIEARNSVNGTNVKPSRKSFNEHARSELVVNGWSGFDDLHKPEEGTELYNEANRLFFIWFRSSKKGQR